LWASFFVGEAYWLIQKTRFCQKQNSVKSTSWMPDCLEMTIFAAFASGRATPTLPASGWLGYHPALYLLMFDRA